MAKIKLGNRPKNFKRIVKFKHLDGSEAAIEVQYKYRTRSEFGSFVDVLFADAKEKAPEDGKFSMTELMAKTGDRNAQYLGEILDGWDLDEPLTRENLQQLCDELPAAASALMEDYRTAILDGRVGN